MTKYISQEDAITALMNMTMYDDDGYILDDDKVKRECFITHFDGKKYRQIDETTVLIWPSNKTISITNRSFWRSDDGSEMDKPVGNGFGFSFTAEEFQKIKELYDALNNELQTARGNKS